MSTLVNSVLGGRVRRNDQTTSTEENVVDMNFLPSGDIRDLTQLGLFRVGFWNCGGFPQFNSNAKNTAIRSWINDNKFDVIGFSECNIHWKLLPPDQRLHERTFGWFETRHIATAYCMEWPETSPYQVGGVSLWSINKGAHHVISSGTDPSQMGRWCWTRYRGRNGRVIRIISAYRCVENEQGSISVWSQQRTVLLSKNLSINPRDAFVNDLVNEVAKYVEDGETIILGLDLNENIVTADFSKKLGELGLIEILSERHDTLPFTYIRGSTPIDGIYVSSWLANCKCGYLQFTGDHRPSWIDIPRDTLFGVQINCPPRARRLKLQDPRTVQRYNKFLEHYSSSHHLLERAQALSSRHDSYHPSYVAEYNAIDNLRTQGMQLAEKNCRKLRMGATPYSPEYFEIASMVGLWRLVVKVKAGRSIDSRFLKRQAKLRGVDMSVIRSSTLEEARNLLKTAYDKLHQFSKSASSKRSTWLEDLADARALAGNHSSEQELKLLLHREKQRKEARILKFVLKPNTSSGLTMIQLPSPFGPIEITHKEEMEHHLQVELAARFHQAAHTPFSSPPLLNLLGPLAVSPVAVEILNGTFVCPTSLDYWTTMLIPYLKFVPDYQAIRRDFVRHLTPSDHRKGWQKMKEQTSPGYSTLSFAQFKAASLSDQLCAIDTILADIPYANGISPSRWKKGVDVMLQKKEGVFLVDKLRAILLYESDFNQNNKRFGREIMHLAEKYNALAVEQFGSRKSKSAIDQSLNKALTFDLWRQFRIPGAVCSSDARACYDRMVHPFASICLQRLGAPVEPIISMFSTIQDLQHHIRTIHGNSETFFSGADWPVPIHGVGQGNGAGPQIWAAVSTPIFNMIRGQGCGSFFESAITREGLNFVGFAFVDDTDLVASNFKNLTGDQVVQEIQLALSAWQGGLAASGGALAPEKSHWYFVDFKWQNGSASYKKCATTPGRLQLRDHDGVLHDVRQLEPNKAERTLGVYIAPNGSMKTQFEHMKKQAITWCDKLRTGQLSRHLVTQAMVSTILKSLEYPLPVTTLSSNQCAEIMSPILQQCLPQMGVVRTLSHKLVYASSKFLGLQIPNLFHSQGVAHIDRLLRFFGSKQLTGELLRHSAQALRLEVGCNGSLMELPYSIFGPLACKTWMKHTWEFLCDSKVALHIDVPEFPLRRENDSLLIPLFVSLGYRGEKLVKLNKCRMFLQVVTLSDICCGDGHSISHNSWHGIKSFTQKQFYLWPNQGTLSYLYWEEWRGALGKLCSGQRQLRSPLGRWLQRDSTYYFYEEQTDRLYMSGSAGCFYFPRIPGRPSRSAVSRFLHKYPCEDIPATACPATVDLHRSYTHLTGCAEVLVQPPIPRSNILLFLKDQGHYLARWVCEFCTFVGNIEEFVDLCHRPVIDLVAVSDGSFKDSHGTASWRISIQGHPDYFHGLVIVPGTPQCQSAYRSELAGLYSICYVVHQLESYLQCACNTEIGCDGLSAIQMCAEGSDTLNPNASHFDLITGTRHLVSKIHGSISWRHIKGHQDEDATLDLDMWAEFNIQMDSAAKLHWQNTYLWDRTNRNQKILGESGSVTLRGEKIVTHLKEKLMSYLGEDKAIEYWESRFGWDKGMGSSINWDMLGYAHKALKPARKVWVTKSASGCCSVGKMKLLWKFSDSAKCPRCQCDMEDFTHVLQCQQVEAKALWKSKISELKQWMLQHYISPSVAIAICDHLNHWNCDDYPLGSTASVSSAFNEVFEKQNENGWESFLLGFWVSDWFAVQEKYLQTIKCKISIRRWASSIIRKLWNIAWDMWDHRNQWLHHQEEGELIQKLHSELRSQYELGCSSLPRAEKLLFRTSLVDLLKSSVTVKQSWLRRVSKAREALDNPDYNGTLPYAGERRMMRTWIRNI
jgi:hypothetical protein